ncbi:hypothetical protein D3C77_20700 [compost metagenome]
MPDLVQRADGPRRAGWSEDSYPARPQCPVTQGNRLRRPAGRMPRAAGRWPGPPNSASYYAELCPFGLPGDRLWVRETFALLGNEDGVCIDWNDQVQKGDERQAARIYRAAAVSGIMVCGRFLIRPTGSRRPKACSTRALGVRAFTCRAGPAASCWKSPMCA